MKTKPRVIKDLEAADPAVITAIISKYPMGFAKHLVSFTDLKGKKVMALPFETEDASFMLKITKDRARAIMLTGAPVPVPSSGEDEVFDIVEIEEVNVEEDKEETKTKKKSKTKAKAKVK